jgi:hypothetical protein
MATQITINSVTSGTSPYDIWVCDTCYGTCQYIDTTTTIPYSFILPSVYETYISYVVKIIDDNGCVYCQDESSFKQFQIGDLFEFMDGDQYKFQ